MNFAQMLMGEQTIPPPKAKKPNMVRSRNCAAANKARHDQAVARYKAVMGTDWVRTAVIESRRGVARAACYDALNSYEALGLVEKRPVGGTFVRIKGYEWRFK